MSGKERQEQEQAQVAVAAGTVDVSTAEDGSMPAAVGPRSGGRGMGGGGGTDRATDEFVVPRCRAAADPPARSVNRKAFGRRRVRRGLRVGYDI